MVIVSAVTVSSAMRPSRNRRTNTPLRGMLADLSDGLLHPTDLDTVNRKKNIVGPDACNLGRSAG
jgi:hypothetical protein